MALVRTPRTLPKILDPAEVGALMAALRRWRDRAMVEAMVLGGLRRCEVLGLRLGDLRPGENRVFVAEGKGGHQRLVPMSRRFFASVAAYLESERPPEAAGERLFVVLKGPRRGRPLSADGLDEIWPAPAGGPAWPTPPAPSCATPASPACGRRAWPSRPCRPQAGHRSIESTRVYLHLAGEWLADEYRRAAEVIDAFTAQAVAR